MWAAALLIGAVWVFLDEEAAGQSREQTTPASPAPTTTASPSAASPSPSSPSAASPCERPSPDCGLEAWSCAHPSGRYAVEVVADDPLTASSVTATAYEVPDGDAERFFAYVLGLSLQDSAALDPEAFVSGAVPAGGAAFAGDAGVGAYGTRGARAMEVTAGEF